MIITCILSIPGMPPRISSSKLVPLYWPGSHPNAPASASLILRKISSLERRFISSGSSCSLSWFRSFQHQWHHQDNNISHFGLSSPKGDRRRFLHLSLEELQFFCMIAGSEMLLVSVQLCLFMISVLTANITYCSSTGPKNRSGPFVIFTQIL